LEIYLAQQTVAFLWSLGVGAAMGLLYDLFRVSRLALPASAALVAGEDILFFAVCGVAAFLFLLSSAEGKVRFFLLAGQLLGAVLYFATLSHAVMGLARGMIAAVRGLLRFLFRYLILPIWRLCYRIIWVFLLPFRFLAQLLKKACQRCKYGLKKWRILLYNQKKNALRRLIKKETGNAAEKGRP
jgi:spore cortex biosynthesis protein YabQ